MKIKRWLMVGALGIVLTAGISVSTFKNGVSLSPSASEPARPQQSTPEGTVKAMFLMADQGGLGDNPSRLLQDRLDDAHLLLGREMSPAEEEFAGLFLDHERSAAIYHFLRMNLTRSATITGTSLDGRSAEVTVAVQIVADQGSDWVPASCTVDLRKRGPNWYVEEVRSPRSPRGAFAAFKQLRGATP